MKRIDNKGFYWLKLIIRTISDIQFLQYDTEAYLIFGFGSATAEMQDRGWESGFKDERGLEINLAWGVFLRYHPDGDIQHKMEMQLCCSGKRMELERETG